jgi:formamidopyrimidine-DNA glycosylase
VPEGHSLVLAARRIEPVVGQHVMRTAAGDVVIAGTSRVEVVRSVRLRLGPDLLGETFETVVYVRRARRLERPVAELLLDQRVLAGIGNIVRAEVLWELRQDPFAPAASLSDRRLLELAAAARRMLRAGGVYRQTGRPCPRCAKRGQTPFGAQAS